MSAVQEGNKPRKQVNIGFEGLTTPSESSASIQIEEIEPEERPSIGLVPSIQSTPNLPIPLEPIGAHFDEVSVEGETESSETESQIIRKYGFIPEGYLETRLRRLASIKDFEVDDTQPDSCVCSAETIVLEAAADPGVIDLSFPEFPDSELIEKYCLPPSYYTVSQKERLLLLFAENFRRQFSLRYPKKRPLVLAAKNECGVQKFVSTTIRPTGFIFPQLIGNLEEICSFVADFIIYEPLENPISLPPRLISPDMLLRLRLGNSFEMATLLCSMLIGAGFPAVVVSGTARFEVTKNDQKNVECPFIPEEANPNADKEKDEKIDTSKYALKEPPDLVSHLEEELERLELEKKREENRAKEEEERHRQELLEMQSDDRFHGRRMHAWVAIIENAPWSVKIRQKRYNEDGEEIIETPQAFFIEPTTGFRHEVNWNGYIQIDSIWNDYNYYVNCQDCYIKDMHWDLSDTNDWEHFLPGEPIEMRIQKEPSFIYDEINITDIWLEKHLDMITSWVEKLHIGLADLEKRFPHNQKLIHFKKATYIRYSPYSKEDGKVTQLTLFADDLYHVPITRWQHFRNRKDFLESIKVDFVEKQIEESFQHGRPDKMKFYEHSAYKQKPRFLYFNDYPRADALYLLELSETKIILHFKKRPDLCYYQEFETDKSKNLMHIIDKFNRNEKIPANKDIAIRHFDLNENKILLTFHYDKGAITASTREFIKPPKPDYGQEIIFDFECTKGYNANPTNPDPAPVELYFLLLKQMDEETRLKREYYERVEEIDTILSTRNDEMKNPVLKFHLFDPLRNQAARRIHMQEYEEEQRRRREIAMNDPDFLAPYLVIYTDRKPNFEESWAAYHACLNDLKTRYVNLLNKLQRNYEDLTAEAKALKKFIEKFHDQFDDFDYNRLLKEKKDIELNKRMVQQRLNVTHEEAQKKYEKVKESLLLDSRLNLRKEATKELNKEPSAEEIIS